MSSRFIWGLLLVLLGLSILSKTIFGFAIPFIRILLAIYLMYIGFMLLMGAMGYSTNIFFPFTSNKSKIKYMSHSKTSYSVVFTNGTIDLSDLTITQQPTTVDISTVFGNSTLILDPALPTQITVNNVFSRTLLPDGTEFTAMSEKTVTIGPENQSPHLIIKANVVFGNLVISKK
jgi:hypothetical protein